MTNQQRCLLCQSPLSMTEVAVCEQCDQTQTLLLKQANPGSHPAEQKGRVIRYRLSALRRLNIPGHQQIRRV